MITGFSHVSIAVPSLDAAAKRLLEMYGLVVGEPMVNMEQGIRLAYIDLGNARIELMEPARADSSISKFLEHHPGGGIHHFCLNVDDVVATAAGVVSFVVRAPSAAIYTLTLHDARTLSLAPSTF